MSTNPVDTLKNMSAGDEALRCAVEVENHALLLLSVCIRSGSKDELREELGGTKFDEMMHLASRREKLGEVQFKLIRFRELKAKEIGESDRN
jgi:hypothetical protein